MQDSPEVEQYKRQLRQHVAAVAPIFANASVGDFTKDVEIPPQDDELSVFFVGVQIMLDAIREKVEESESALARLNVANNELQHEKAIYGAILSSIGEGLVVVDKDARITLMNQMAADMLGLDVKAMPGCNYYDIVVTRNRDGQDVPVSQRPLHQAVVKGRKQTKTLADGLQYVHSNGTAIPVSITASPVKLGNEIVGAVSTFRDISDEKHMDRTKSEIISIASHQLRTPLTAIKWVSEALLTPVSKLGVTKRRKYLRQIHDSNERMIALVNDLLNVSRVELGTLSLNPKPFDLTQMIDDVLKDLSSQIKAKHLRVKKVISPDLETFVADPRHIQVILQNLLSNAVKYSPVTGKHTITIRVAKQDRQLALAVKDEGCGVPAEQQSKIFSKLFRADNGRKLSSEGSGLGLYVCKAMVEQLGGKIWFESVEDKGSTFFVAIPWNKPPAPDNSSVQA